MADPDRLLDRCLPYLRDVLFGVIECDSNLRTNAVGEVEPIPGTMGDETEAEAREIISLIRDVECQVGTPVPSPGPQWLDDVIDGRAEWKDMFPERGA